MNEELKPCPFCGRSDSLYSLPQSVTIPVGGGRILNDWAVGCKQCSFSIKRMTYRKDNAIETWNTRPIEDTLTATIAQKDAEIKRLRSLLKSVLENEQHQHLALLYDNWYLLIRDIKKVLEVNNDTI